MKQKKSYVGSVGGVSKNDGLLAYSFLTPILLILMFFMLYPLLEGLKLGLTDEEGNFSLINFTLLFSESRFATNFRMTVLYVTVVVFAAISTGILAAHLITEESKFINILRPLYLIPWVIPPAASGILFKSLLDGGRGPIPKLVKTLTGETFMPLADPNLAIVAGMLHEYWRAFPFAMLFIAAGLTTIPRDIYEASTIDGASKWKQFTSITLPLLKNHLFIVTLMTTNATLQGTESIYSLTQGGPGYSTETIAVRMFKSAFVYYEINTGAACGILLLIIAICFMFIYRKVVKVQEEELYE